MKIEAIVLWRLVFAILIMVIPQPSSAEQSNQNVQSRFPWAQLQHGRSSKSDAVILRQLDDSVYMTEHALFLVENTGRVNWPDYYSIAGGDNLNYCFMMLNRFFPRDFASVTLIFNDVVPNQVPVYAAVGPSPADGIGRTWAPGQPFDYCLYNAGGGPIDSGTLAVFDHELGHRWGIFTGPMESSHWVPHSTITDQMSAYYSDDGFQSIKIITGDEKNGFRWQAASIIQINQEAIYSDQTLYLMGMNPEFPTAYVLKDPVYQANGGVLYSSFEKWDQARVAKEAGWRNPDYIFSAKQIPLAFIYIARDQDELNRVYVNIENAIKFFCYSAELDTVDYRFTVPFLKATKLRGSVHARLGDLDGNTSPILQIPFAYYQLQAGQTTEVEYHAEDLDGSDWKVEALTYANLCEIGTDRMRIGPFKKNGSYFFTIRVTDSGGKMAFAHFVVDVSGGISGVKDEFIAGRRVQLYQNHPNPFNNRTQLEFTLTEMGEVELSVWDVLGRRVRLIERRKMEPGTYRRIWDGRDDAGQEVVSGVYLMRLEAGSFRDIKRMAFVK
jgi:hypothetical protein